MRALIRLTATAAIALGLTFFFHTNAQALNATEALVPTAEEAPDVPTSFAEPPAVGTKARCPVMGGVFTVTEKTEHSEYKGRHYAFCCSGCKPKFDKAPQNFLKNK